MADMNGNAVNKVEKLTMEEIADRLEGLKSSLDTIRRTASELISGQGEGGNLSCGERRENCPFGV